MITSLALTVKQPSQRPLHVPRCSITIEKDHFEFVAHGTEKNNGSGGENDDDDDFVNRPGNVRRSKHIGSYRALEPPPTQTFVVRIFFRDIQKMEIVPEICQIIVSTQSPSQSAFFGPAAPFLPDRLPPKNLPKFPGVESSSDGHGDDEDEEKEAEDDEKDHHGGGSNKIANNVNVSGASSKSRSPPPRPQQQKQAVQRQQPNNVMGHTILGGIRRQYILLFTRDHITEVWYKALTEAVESWAELLVDGRRNAAQLARLIRHRNAMDNNGGDDDEDGELPKNFGAGSYDDEDFFIQQDVLDVEQAIATLSHDYNRDALGWSTPKQRQNQRQRQQQLRQQQHLGRPHHVGPFTYRTEQEARQQEHEHQMRLEATRRTLIPQWEDLAALREQIVGKIATAGALGLAHESPPRKVKRAADGEQQNQIGFTSAAADAKKRQEEEASPKGGAADEFVASSPRRNASPPPPPPPPRPLLSTKSSHVRNVGTSSVPLVVSGRDVPLLQTPQEMAASAVSASAAASTTALLLVPGRSVSSQLVAPQKPPQQHQPQLLSTSSSSASSFIAHRAPPVPASPPSRPLLSNSSSSAAVFSSSNSMGSAVFKVMPPPPPPAVPAPGVKSALPRSTTPPPEIHGVGAAIPLLSTSAPSSAMVLPPPERKPSVKSVVAA